MVIMIFDWSQIAGNITYHPQHTGDSGNKKLCFGMTGRSCALSFYGTVLN